jgi:hypothetical protein
MDYSSIFGGKLMDVLFRVKMNGRAVAAVPTGNDCATLLCSWLAMQELMRQLSEIGAVCARCGIVLRSSEMNGNECAPGVGCRGDSDLNMILELPPNVRINALTKCVVECEENFKRRGGSNAADNMEE